MLILHNATDALRGRKVRRRKAARIGLAVAGGGPIGGMYELGALRALDLAIEGFDLTDLGVYVGVSSGAFLAASLANGIDTGQMTRIFLAGDDADVRFRPNAFLRPAFGEYARRAMRLPVVAFNWWQQALRRPFDGSVAAATARLGELIPTGLFDNAGIERYLADVFSRSGRTNDFRKLNRRLYVVAVDLDSGEAERFGSPGLDHVPISVAVTASAALPGLYPPVAIDGRDFVDGALRRTMHASIAFEEGIDLLIGLNPLVPYDAAHARQDLDPFQRGAGAMSRGGLPMVLSQTLRTLLQSRVQVGLAKYQQQYSGVDQMVFEPQPDDHEMFFTNIFSYGSRRRLCQHAFASTLADLRRMRDVLAPMLARHGLRLRDEMLDGAVPDLLADTRPGPRRQTPATAELRRLLAKAKAQIRSED